MSGENPFGNVTMDAETLQESINTIFGSLTKVGEAMNEATRGLSDVFAAIDEIVKEADANARR